MNRYCSLIFMLFFFLLLFMTTFQPSPLETEEGDSPSQSSTFPPDLTPDPNPEPNPFPDPPPPPIAYIILDPGHGGKEEGAKGWTTGVKEKDIVLSIANFTQKWLSEHRVKAFLTRIGDYALDPTLRKDLLLRARFADTSHLQAVLFVSIHIDQFNKTVHGTKVYYSTENPFPKESKALARTVHDHLVQEIGSKPLDVHMNHFLVLRHNTVPAVLVEVGHLSHPEEEKLLITPQYQELAAIGIGKGILAYLEATHHSGR
ncbi:N-acetylmuramoyl-L-alanine amidase [Ammoniphilus sp. YIM 78166]|uniref:N-acetylmuramoyl-L-alanine amidase family protein n=1 Tax=Ammoniphilus sp. YIM 78166 TaxID=1644106 RepID=UPI00143222B3|nr:N-acetylmuramoyl-L-alanine amidase [Ammoniphilus sp. YIM 78166]